MKRQVQADLQNALAVHQAVFSEQLLTSAFQPY